MRRLHAALFSMLLCSFGCGGSSTPEPTSCEGMSASPASITLLASGGSGRLAILAPDGCRWYIASEAEWLRVTAGMSGEGPGEVAYVADANATPFPRTSGLVVGTMRVVVSQQGVTPSECPSEIRPAEKDVAVTGGSFEVRVLTPYGCRWTFGGNVAWLRVVADPFGDPNGNGNGTVVAVVDPNPDPASRTGTATIAGQTLVVRQAGTAQVRGAGL